MGSVPDQGTKILQGVWCGQKIYIFLYLENELMVTRGEVGLTGEGQLGGFALTCTHCCI